MKLKRFTISKPYEGPPVATPWGGEAAEGLEELVEQYDDEYTARVRVAVLNHGLAKKVFFLEECIDQENDEWVRVNDGSQ